MSVRPLLALTSQSMSYGVGIFLRQFISIASIALFAHALTQEQFGILALTTSVLTLAQNVTGPGIIPTVFRLYNDSKDPVEQRRVLGATQITYIGYMGFVALVIWIFATTIATNFLKSEEYTNIVRMLAFLLLTEGPYTLAHTFLRIQERPIASSLQSVFHIALRVGFSLLFVYTLKTGIDGYWVGQVIGSLLGFVVLLWMVRDMITFRTTWVKLKSVFSYSSAFIPQVFANWINREFDNFLIASVVGLSAVAIYDVGYRIGQFVLLAMTPIATAWPQFIYSRLDQPNAKQLQRDAFTFVTLFVACVAVGLLAIAPYTLDILAPDSYSSAINVIFWSTLAHSFWALSNPYALGIQAAKKPRYLAMIIFISGVLNIGLNLVFVPLIGIVGAAIVTFICYAFSTITVLIVGQRLYPVPIDWSRFLRLGIATLISLLAIHWINFQTFSVPADLALRAGVMLLFVGILFTTRVITPGQIRMIVVTMREMLVNRRSRKAGKRNKMVAVKSSEESPA